MIVLPSIKGVLEAEGAAFSVDIPSLKLAPGKVVYLLGPNGSGKSVYLKSLVGEFRSLNARRIPVKGSAGTIDPILVRQSVDENLALSLSVLDNMILWDRARSTREYLFPRLRKSRILKQLESFASLGLAPDKSVRELSGGQKQGLVLLSRMLRSPRMLLLDEFTSAVDAQSSERLLGIVRSLAKVEGTTSLVVTHDVREASSYADSCIVLAAGKIFTELPLSEMSENERYDQIKKALFEAWEAQVSRG